MVTVINKFSQLKYSSINKIKLIRIKLLTFKSYSKRNFSLTISLKSLDINQNNFQAIYLIIKSFKKTYNSIRLEERLFKITNNCPLSTRTKIPHNLQYFCSLYFLPLIVPRNQVYSYTIPIGIKDQKYVTHYYIRELIYIYIYIYIYI